MHVHDISLRVYANRFFLAISLIAALVLACSFGLEFFGIQPCRLCIYQRIPYALMIAVGCFGIFTNSKTLFTALLVILSLASLSLACYHLGIQQGLFIDPCLIKKAENLDAFKNMIFNPTIPCSTISLSVGGLPVAAWNGAASLLCLVISTNFLILQKGKYSKICVFCSNRQEASPCKSTVGYGKCKRH